MNELEQLRDRLVMLDYINRDDYRYITMWKRENWEEVSYLMDALDLLDPTWEDEVVLHGSLKMLKEVRG
jgi:hypothetical protein